MFFLKLEKKIQKVYFFYDASPTGIMYGVNLRSEIGFISQDS